MLANDDEAKVASFVRFRSAEDWKQATEREEFLEHMRALEAIGTSHADVYERMAVIAPPRDLGPTKVSYGAF